MTASKTALIGAALAVALVSGPASATSSVTPDMVAEAMRKAGYQAEMVPQKDNAPPMIRTGVGGRTARVIFYGCGEAGCQDMSIRTCLRNDKRLDHKALNALNHHARFVKVYLDRDGDLAIEMDTDLEAGATAATAVQSLRVFNQFMGGVLQAIDAAPVERRQESRSSRPGASRLSGEAVQLDDVPACRNRRCRDI